MLAGNGRRYIVGVVDYTKSKQKNDSLDKIRRILSKSWLPEHCVIAIVTASAFFYSIFVCKLDIIPQTELFLNAK